MTTDFDKLLPRSIYTMTVKELNELRDDLGRFKYMIIERIQQLEEQPPTLGIHVSETIKASDVVR
jgi:hypothetical protein